MNMVFMYTGNYESLFTGLWFLVLYHYIVYYYMIINAKDNTELEY